jgi:hypothetical protein
MNTHHDPETSPENDNRLDEIRACVASLRPPIVPRIWPKPPEPAIFAGRQCTPDPARAYDISAVRMTREAIERANENMVYDTLSEAGIQMVLGDFDGCSDSGQIGGMEAVAGDKLVKIPARKVLYIVWKDWQRIGRRQAMDLRSAIEALIYRRLEDDFSGWEIDAGAEGEFGIDVENRRILGEIVMLGEDAARPCAF